MKNRIILIILLAGLHLNINAARWNKETIRWDNCSGLKLGDWGFNRPGYPKGLYIHEITVKEGEKVKNPVIYDNDVYDDVFEDEWMYAMASLGKLRISALIVTPVLTDFWGFYKPDWIATAHESRNNALQSGVSKKRLPPITIGTEAESEKSAEKRISEGAQRYVEIINSHYKKYPQLPVIINIGGQAATLASAYCIDPSIAEKCIVDYTDICVYNGHFEWASKLVAKHFRVVSCGQDNWWRAKKQTERMASASTAPPCQGGRQRCNKW